MGCFTVREALLFPSLSHLCVHKNCIVHTNDTEMI